MRLPPLLPGLFIERKNRFLAFTMVDGGIHPTFVPNSGRMEELLVKGARVYLKDRRSLPGKTHYELVLVEKGDVLVGVDSRMPPGLLEEAIHGGLAFPGYRPKGREPSLERGRVDLLLVGPGGRDVWVETKSVNLVEDGVALFPDAPTVRGVRHLMDLLELVEKGGEAHVAFIVQRPDARVFSPHRQRDPDFARALKEAMEGGVGVRAFWCDVSLQSIEVKGELPISL